MVLKLKEKENSLPQFDFYSKQAVESDLLKATAKYETNLSMRNLNDDFYNCYRFYYRIGDVKPSVKIFELKNIPQDVDFKVNEIALFADAYFVLNDRNYLKFGTTILCLENDKLINCYYIK